MSFIEILKKIPSANERRGSFGEYFAASYARRFIDALVLKDVLIDGGNGQTSQIDMILIGAKGLYVVEVKLYQGAKVYGDGTRSTWYYYRGGKEYDIYSPLMQNEGHIRSLKKLLADFGDIPMFSVVTMICKSFRISNINPPGVIESGVCNSLPSMKKVLQLIAKDKPAVLDDAKKRAIYDYILAHQHTGKEERQKHTEAVRELKKSVETLKQNGLCPRCRVPLVPRKGKYGEFYACPNYPRCRYTQKENVSEK